MKLLKKHLRLKKQKKNLSLKQNQNQQTKLIVIPVAKLSHIKIIKGSLVEKLPIYERHPSKAK